jgi:hypothetical protein
LAPPTTTKIRIVGLPKKFLYVPIKKSLKSTRKENSGLVLLILPLLGHGHHHVIHFGLFGVSVVFFDVIIIPVSRSGILVPTRGALNVIFRGGSSVPRGCDHVWSLLLFLLLKLLPKISLLSSIGVAIKP